jgi:acetyltransferase
MGGADVDEGVRILNRASIPTFPYPDTAARMFVYMANYSLILKRLYETPVLRDGENLTNREHARQILDTVRQSGRTILTEYESKQLLAAYGIPTVETRIAQSPEEAVEAAETIGYPVVLKIHSETITHKTDVGGVQLNLKDASSVRDAYTGIESSVNALAGEFDADGKRNFLGVTVQPMSRLEGYELILGSSVDPQFGPVLLFGLGGQLVEVFKDRALGLPPLTTTLARRMMERTRIYTALKGVRGRASVDMAQLEELMVRFSQLIAEQPMIKELDINPLIASPEKLLALDARVVVYDKNVENKQLARLAIRAYPSRYISQWTANDGKPITIRPIRPEDEPLLAKFHEMLSDRTVILRYMHPMQLIERVRHERLARICHCDYNREITLVAEYTDPETGEKFILAASRLSKIHGENEARFTVLVADPYQGIGLGREMLDRIIQVAKAEKLELLHADITVDNHGFQKMVQSFGFSLTPAPDGKMMRALLKFE